MFTEIIFFRTYLFSVLLLSFFRLGAQIGVETNIPAYLAPGSSFSAEVKISKGNLIHFAKYQMDLPAGMNAFEGQSQGGKFSFENGRLKLVWFNLPVEAEFSITFLINVPSSAMGSTVINHRFYYVDNGVKKDFEPESLPVKFDTDTNNAYENKEITSAEAPTTEIKTMIAPDSPTVIAIQTKEPLINGGAYVSIDSIVYKLQLGALGSDPGKAKYASVGNVNIVRENGFYKVLLGSYSSKEEALKKREELQQKGISSFVVTYRNGLRQK